MTTIREVRTASDRHAFFSFPVELYRESPYAVPSLIHEEKQTFDTKKNPAYDHVETVCFIAEQGGRCVGRIAGLINRMINELSDRRDIRFTRFDVIDDPEVSRMLIEAVEQWGRDRGMERIIGPMGFSGFDKQGLLIEGFEEQDMLITLYNYPYYGEHLEQLGFEKEIDWLEFEIKVPREDDERIERICQIAQKRHGYRLLTFTDKKQVLPYAGKMFAMYNEAFAELYGFSPLTEAQVELIIKQFISLISLEYLFVVVDSTEQVLGFGIMIPSLSDAVRKSRGRLLPLGWWRIRKALKDHRVLDMYLVAVKPEYSGRGVNAVILNEGIKRAIANGVEYAYSGPELEDNENVQSQWKSFQTRQHRRRRCYQRKL